MATKCDYHDLTLEQTSVLSDRYEELADWPHDQRAAMFSPDPRCGCGSDNEGSVCEWDSLTALEQELDKRSAE